MARRKAGDISRWLGTIIGGRRGAELIEEGRVRDMRQDKTIGAHLRDAAEKSPATDWRTLVKTQAGRQE